MVSIRKRRPSGLSPDKHGQPQTYRTLPFLLSSREMTVGSAEELKPNEDITSKQEVGSTCNIASSLPQSLNQLYAPNLFPKGISAYQCQQHHFPCCRLLRVICWAQVLKWLQCNSWDLLMHLWLGFSMPLSTMSHECQLSLWLNLAIASRNAENNLGHRFFEQIVNELCTPMVESCWNHWE